MDEILAVIETSIYAEDLAAAEAFYAQVLGLPLLGREEGRHLFFGVGPASMLLVFDPSVTIVGDVMTPHGAHGPGHVALGVATTSLDAWRERLRSHGVAIEREITWPRGGRSLYFRDPAGNSIEIITPGVWGLPDGW